MPAPTFATGDVPSAAQVNSWMVNVLTAYKTADESVTSSTTYQDDDQLTLSVEANCVYDMAMILSYDGSGTADIKTQLVLPAGAVIVGVVSGLLGTAATSGDDFTTAWVGIATVGCIGAGSTQSMYCRGLLTTAGTAGICKLQWAQNALSVTATRVFTGSYMTLRRIA